MKGRLEQSTQISKSWDIFWNIIMTLLGFICLFPLLLVAAVSITDETSLVQNGYSLFPKDISFSAYEYLLGDIDKIIQAYGVSIFVTVIGCLLSLLVITMYAYPISRNEFKFKKVFSFIVFFILLFNGGLIPVYIVYTKVLGLKDNLIALILFWMMNPFYVMIARTYFRTSIPDSVVEAARIDGAGQFKTFIQIVLPLAKPVLATIVLFQILWYWNDWYAPMLFIQDETLFNLQYLMYRTEKNIQFLITNSNPMVNAGIADLPSQTARMAMAIIAIGPMVAMYPFFQRYFIAGITLGATKE